jgi:hypothetical protein
MAYILYSVVRARTGWAVNNGADTLTTYASHEDAREDAIQRANTDLALGLAASFEDGDDLEEEPRRKPV